MREKRTRQLMTVLLLIGALLSILGAGAVISARQVRLQGALNGTPDRSLPPRQPILGVNVELTQYGPEALSENLDLIAQTGFVWVRQVFAWDAIEPSPGQYDWAIYDAIVRETHERDLRLVAVLWRSPAWAAPEPTAPPGDLNAFGAFAEALAERYGDRVDVYQIWDEPNLSAGWGGRAPSAVEYAALLEAAYTAIHAADPEALVLTAGLAPTIETGPNNLNDVLYLRALYENGAAPFFDGVAGKPYGFDSGPEDRHVDINLLNFSRFLLLRQEMERHGDSGKPLWASHFGWNSLPGGWNGQPSLWGQTLPETQASRTLAAYQRALTEWPWAGALILETWQPDAPADDPHWGFALRLQDGTLSPTADAIRSQAALFNTALWPGVYPAANDLVSYTGEWEFSELGADFSQNGTSVVDVPFVGDSLAVIVRRDNYRAYLYVTVDGQPSSVLPQDERGAYLVLTSPDYMPHVETLVVADNLDPSSLHVAHIEAERGWDQWALIGFAVGAKVDTSRYDWLIGGLAVLTITLAGLALRVGRGLSWMAVLDRGGKWLFSRAGDAVHFMLSAGAALAVWAGAALTWGGILPNLLRRMGDGPSLIITAMTAGIFYFSPWLLLTLIALVALFLLIYARPSVGLALMMAFTPYYLLPRPLFDRAFSMVEVTSLLTLLAWAIHIIAERRERGWPSLGGLWSHMTGLDKAVTLFVGIAIISLSWAELLGVAITELRQMVLEPVVMYLVLRTMPLSWHERWRIIDLLILTGAIVALYGFYQFASDVVAIQGFVCLRSVFGTCNNAALFMGRLIPITVAVVLIGKGKARRWLYGIVGVLMLVAVGLTTSRGGILLGLPAGLGLVIILWAGRTGLIVVGIGVVLEVLALIPLSQLPRFSNLFDFSGGTSSSFFRLQLWQSTLRMLRDHPITGLGLDQFLYQYRGHYILPSAWQQPDLSQPHNFLLNYWVRLGIVGLAAGIWIQVAFWRLGLATQQRLKELNPTARALAVGLAGSMAAFIAHGLVDEVHFVIDLAFIFFMTLGLMHQLGEEASHGDHHQWADTAVG
jgi:O-antigen ligase